MFVIFALFNYLILAMKFIASISFFFPFFLRYKGLEEMKQKSNAALKSIM